jgi:hypothetical protein
MYAAIQCAKAAIEERTTLFFQIRNFMKLIGAKEVGSCSGIFEPETNTPTSFVWLDDDGAPKIVKDIAVVPQLILDYAVMAMGKGAGGDFNNLLADIVRPTLSGPALSLKELQSRAGRFGYNGGQGCDTVDGPCSCGAWHRPNELI